MSIFRHNRFRAFRDTRRARTRRAVPFGPALTALEGRRLLSFSLSTLASYSTSANVPLADLALDSQGNLYGTMASVAGSTLYEIKAGTTTATTLATFTTSTGAGPNGGLLIDSAGDVFGTARGGRRKR